ncbi:VOC family protein [Klenkia terrae]|uniref:VOC family protein n=1 Tax=Klenkia terrae TaxID=1052259 RepID=UPI00361436F7
MTAPEKTRLITHLRHIDLAVPDLRTQTDFFTNTWGLKEETTDSGLSFLAAEGSPEQYVVRLREAADKRIDLISFGAANRADVDTLAARMATAGVQLVHEPTELQTPGGGYGFRFFDNEGRTVEVSADVAVREHRKIEEGESIPVRLSHVVINSSEPEKTVAFYEQHFGFALSDTLMHPRMGNMMYFLRTNAWHHSLAVARGPHPRCTTPPSSCAASTSTCAAPAGRCARAWRRSGARAGTWPGTTRSPTSWTRTATPWSTRPSWTWSTRTPGTPRCTTSPTPRSATSGAPRTR